MAESAAPPAAAAPPRVCAVCAAEAVEQCVRCKVTAYCSRRCQKRHWNRGGHKYRCFSPEERARRAAFNTPANRQKLWFAAFSGDEAAARDLTARGADVNYREPRSGATPLLIAAQKGATPLFIAAVQGHDAVVRALLDAGADKTKRCKHGQTAWDKAKSAETKHLVTWHEAHLHPAHPRHPARHPRHRPPPRCP